jgi:hypothetical protein
MAPAGWIKWVTAEAREIILFDLIEGVLPLTEEEFPTKDAWEVYREFPEFIEQRVVFSQFKERLKGHREQVTLLKARSTVEEDAFLKHMQLHPLASHNRNGELMWDRHPAKPLLQEDVKNRAHVGVTPSEFRKTRPEYLAFKANIFKQRIYQEIRRQKFIFYLNLDREEKLQKLRERVAKAKKQQEKARRKAASNHN